MTSVDIDQLTTITGGHAGHDHGTEDPRTKLLRRINQASPQARANWSQCVNQSVRDIASNDPARQAQGRAAQCSNLLSK
jgi:hypothetical protein